MKRFTIFFVFVLFALFAFNCGNDDETPTPVPNPVDTTSVDTTEEVDILPLPSNYKFVHPGMLHKQADFDRVKAKVEQGESPWAEAWTALTNNSHSFASYVYAPVTKLIRGGGSTEEPEADNYSRAFNDVAAAYQLALRWKISGDTIFAARAVKILNAWATTCKSISGNSNVMLAAGIYGYQFANAAEILRDYDGWAANDFDAFKKWLLDIFYPLSSDFLVRHNGTCISHYWANWDLCNIANIMAIGILTDNVDIYNEAFDYLLNGKGNGNLINTVYYIHDDGLGQLQESGRDQGHALLCVGFLGTICEMAWNQGQDLYGYDDNRVLRGAEYGARYNFNLGSVKFQPYNNCDNVNHTVVSENGKGNKRPIWDILYNHYVKRAKVAAPNVEIVARMHRPDGGGGDYGSTSGGFDALGFTTLMYTLD